MKPPEEVKLNLVRQWLHKAEEDFTVANHLVSDETLFFTAVGFHSQQAAEKYLKAFLVSHQVEFPKTHDLDELLDIMETIDKLLADSLREITCLTMYGVEIRYPGDIPEMTAKEAKGAVELITQVRESILRALDEKATSPIY